MASKRNLDEDVLKLLSEIELKLTARDEVASAGRSVRISDATFYNWRMRFRGMGRRALILKRQAAKTAAACALSLRFAFNFIARVRRA